MGTAACRQGRGDPGGRRARRGRLRQQRRRQRRRSRGGSAGAGAASQVPTAGLPVLKTVGKGEGTLNLIAWEGYLQPLWVDPFQKQTGCQVHATYAGTSDQMVALMKNGGGGQYDMVSSSGDADLRIIYAGDAHPVNIGLIPSWNDFFPAFKSPAFNTVNGVHYGVSLQWGPNVLMYNKKSFSTAPTSWNVIYNPKYKGQVTVPDNPIQIADAALYLKTAQPSLHITDPYELTQPQFQAAVGLLAKQRPLIKKYWDLASQEISEFKNGDAIVGAGWPYQVSALKGTTSRSARWSRPRARPAGPTPGCWLPRRRTPTARTCGCGTSARRRSRRSRQSTTARRRTTSSPAATWTRSRRAPARSTTPTRPPATSSRSRCGRRRSRPATTASRTACPTAAVGFRVEYPGQVGATGPGAGRRRDGPGSGRSGPPRGPASRRRSGAGRGRGPPSCSPRRWPGSC